MNPEGITQMADNPKPNQMEVVGSGIDFIMQQYHPYLRPDLSLEQLSVISNMAVCDLEYYLNQSSTPTLDHYLDGWRIKHVKKLMALGKAKGLELKTLGLLSGFSSERKFVEAYKKFEGHSPEMDF